jgi:hypothetical protein
MGAGNDNGLPVVFRVIAWLTVVIVPQTMASFKIFQRFFGGWGRAAVH